MFKILIDEDSVKRNPRAGQTLFFIPGRWQTTIEGNRITHHHDVQRIHTMSPAPAYLFDYEITIIKCKYCGEGFLYTELGFDDYFDGEDDYCITNICPRCKTADCCEYRLETIEECLERIKQDE